MDRTPPTLDMRLDGSFRTEPKAGVPVSFKLMVGGILLALTAGAVAVAALAIWVVSLVLPVLVAGRAVRLGHDAVPTLAGLAHRSGLALDLLEYYKRARCPTFTR